jgi:hypothetical protein
LRRAARKDSNIDDGMMTKGRRGSAAPAKVDSMEGSIPGTTNLQTLIDSTPTTLMAPISSSSSSSSH